MAVHDARATKEQGVAHVLQGQNLSEPRLVVFGDQINDAGMFRMADEAYAVAGAVPKLAQHATQRGVAEAGDPELRHRQRDQGPVLQPRGAHRALQEYRLLLVHIVGCMNRNNCLMRRRVRGIR